MIIKEMPKSMGFRMCKVLLGPNGFGYIAASGDLLHSKLSLNTKNY